MGDLVKFTHLRVDDQLQGLLHRSGHIIEAHKDLVHFHSARLQLQKRQLLPFFGKG